MEMINITEKYEEFKKWFVNQDTYIFRNLESGDNANMIIFKKFEEVRAEKKKEKEIKQLIEQALSEEHCCSDGKKLYTNAIYDKLKEKDLIK